MLRGEIRLTDLDPARGREANKRRPAVIVSNDRANAAAARLGRGVVTIVPVTSSTSRIFPFQTLLPAAETGLRVDSRAQAEQVRSVTIQRLGPVVARVPPTLLAHLDDALRLHLQLRTVTARAPGSREAWRRARCRRSPAGRRGSPAEEVERWRAEPGQGDIAVGGAALVGEVAAAGLMDEFRVYPVLVGGGTPYFPRA